MVIKLYSFCGDADFSQLHKFIGITLTASYLYGLSLNYRISACDVYGCDAYIGLNLLGQHIRYTFKF